MGKIKDKANAIRAIIVYEVLGRPKDYVERVMEIFLEKLKEKDNLEMIRKEILPATQLEGKNIFSIVAETEFYFKDIEVLLGFMVDTMPSSIEIIHPTHITLDLPKINAFINDYLTKIHQYDDVLKKLKLEREILIRRISHLESLIEKKGKKEEEKREEEKKGKEGKEKEKEGEEKKEGKEEKEKKRG